MTQNGTTFGHFFRLLLPWELATGGRRWLLLIASLPDNEIHTDDVGWLSSTAVVHQCGPGLKPDVLTKLAEESVVATQPLPSGHHCVSE